MKAQVAGALLVGMPRAVVTRSARIAAPGPANLLPGRSLQLTFATQIDRQPRQARALLITDCPRPRVLTHVTKRWRQELRLSEPGSGRKGAGEAAEHPLRS